VSTRRTWSTARGKELNFEFIQEIEVKTGGYEAEHGRSTAGIVNVITKSGGNEFHGDLLGCFNDESLQADNEHVGETLEGAELGFEKKGCARTRRIPSVSATISVFGWPKDVAASRAPGARKPRTTSELLLCALEDSSRGNSGYAGCSHHPAST
jgi:hypothetical protein